ncbi:MAG: SAM-dependent methyltransferase [Methanospirillum sp.]|nr:SAM-dependent methyltransferase [Methanospirillum sp.]
MHARAVPLDKIRQNLSGLWVDTTRRTYVEGGTAYIPVLDGYPYTHVIPERKRNGRGYQKIGDIIAFHGKKPDKDLVREVIASHAPRGVIWYKTHQGNLRIPDCEVLWGETGEVIHREAGVVYRLDPTRVMFSQGNREEKIRLSGLVLPGERVCDMFAGIGYFTLHLARAGALVHAIELNPDACRFLESNVRENRLEDRVIISAGDCRVHLAGVYDRIQMGHYDAADFLEKALVHSRPGTVLHVHSVGDIRDRISSVLRESGYTGELSTRVIKKVGPGKEHMVTDVVIS